jgi:hypothetical protein
MSTSLKQRALSAVSKQYDVDGDGKLDKVEQAMRNLDTVDTLPTTSRSLLSFNNSFECKSNSCLPNVLSFSLPCFSSFCQLPTSVWPLRWHGGTSARLAKDTTTQNNVLVVKDSGQVVATKNHANVYAAQTKVNTERHAQVTGGSFTTSTLTSISCADAQARHVSRM